MHTVAKNDGEERSEQLNGARFEISASLETVDDGTRKCVRYYWRAFLCVCVCV